MQRSRNVRSINGLQDVINNFKSDRDLGDWIEIKDGDGVKFIDDYIPRESEGLEQVEKHKRKITGILCAEIGGMNSMEPLYIAALQNLPVIDADCMGRAFPEFQMMAPCIYGKETTPCCIVDEKGRRAVVLQADSPKKIENQLRHFCIEMGCKGGLSCSPMSKEDVMSTTVLYSLSRTCRLGKVVLAARKEKKDPIEAVLQQENGKLLINGKVSDIARTTSGGFDKGKVTVEGFGEFQGSTLTVEFKNEFLVAWLKMSNDKTQKVAACVPDLISCMDSESGEPITTDEVKYGLRVAVVVLASPPLLRTPRALQYVGPKAFGYPEEEVKFNPVSEYTFHDAIPPK
ncbi:S-methyl thiohydantoin desulfurase-like [Ptychodera flava]|uniref:S-methyl thiohydantoin desulfurase-like n=1 Tax=Ptychodera flava TaxID=63121 RepID=UPI00396A20D0